MRGIEENLLRCKGNRNMGVRNVQRYIAAVWLLIAQGCHHFSGIGEGLCKDQTSPSAIDNRVPSNVSLAPGVYASVEALRTLALKA